MPGIGQVGNTYVILIVSGDDARQLPTIQRESIFSGLTVSGSVILLVLKADRMAICTYEHYKPSTHGTFS